MWETVKKIKEIWRQKPKRTKDYPPVNKTSDFTGLEVKTIVNGEIIYRVLHPAEVPGLSEHFYLMPIRLDDIQQLTGYTIKIHKNLY
jgi:hypothetical protein